MSTTFHTGDVRDLAERLAAEGKRFALILSSPPYFGSVRNYGALRWFATEQEARDWAASTAAQWNAEYGTRRVVYVAQAPWHRPQRKKKPWGVMVVPLSVWGGAQECSHQWGPALKAAGNAQGNGLRETGVFVGRQDKADGSLMCAATSGQFCQLCGAWLGQLGQEPTPDLYAEHIEEIARALMPLLREDGSVWWNIGEVWLDGEPAGIPYLTEQAFRRAGFRLRDRVVWLKQFEARGGFETDLLGDEHEVDLSKGTCMPSSFSGWRWERHRVKVKAKATHEDDAQALAHLSVSRTRAGCDVRKGRGHVDVWEDCPGCPKCSPHGGLVLRKGQARTVLNYEWCLWFAKGESYYGDMEAVKVGARTAPHRLGNAKLTAGGPGGTGRNDSDRQDEVVSGARNLRSAWFIPVEPLQGESHFAAWPTALAERMIKLATSEGGACAKCGSPYARVLDRTPNPCNHAAMGGVDKYPDDPRMGGNHQTSPGLHRNDGNAQGAPPTTRGWLPTCSCLDAGPPVPCQCLDPFGGSGRSAEAAERMGRDCTLFDIVPAYTEMQKRRILGSADAGPLFGGAP